MLRITASFVVLTLLMAGFAADSKAALIVPGSFQGWNPGTAPTMTNLGGGIHELNLSGLAANTNYKFKILEGIDWGDPEWTFSDNWFRSDGAGNALIRLNTNIGATGQDNMNVGINSGSWTPQVVGDFMNEAGGAGDWNPSDSSFNMTNVGTNQWQFNMTISTIGSYEIKITDGSGWSRQFGSNGLHSNPGIFNFTTTTANQQVVVNYNSLVPSFSVAAVPEPTSALLVAAFGMIAGIRRQRRAD